MTQEEKAKAYDDAIERAKKQLDGAKVFDYKEKQIAHDIRTTTYAIFPELKESEDEKIKKALISAINNICNGDEGLATFNGFSKEQVLAWLEKQSGKKPADKCEGCNNIKGCVACVDGSEWAHIEESKSFLSKEDEYNLAFIQEALLGLDGDDSYREKCCKMAEWLESLKGRYTWKPTKDQIDALFAAVYLKALRNTLEKDSVKQLEELYNQLKKLKEE